MQKSATLLHQFDALALGEGSINAGANTVTVNTPYCLTCSGTISGAGGFTKVGGGGLALSGSNSFSGAKKVTAGTLSCSNVAALGTGTLDITLGAITARPVVLTGPRLDDGTVAASGLSVSNNLDGANLSVTGSTSNGGSTTEIWSAAVSSGGGHQRDHFHRLKAATTSSLTLTGSAAGNYTLTQPTGLTANITASPLTITASNQRKTYGQTVTFGSGSTQFTSSGLQNGETIGSVTLACTGGGAAAAVAASNYAIQYVDGTFTVDAVSYGAWASDAAQASTTQVVEYGSNLSGWTPVIIPATSAGIVEITPGSPSDRVKVTIPSGGSQIFVRLKVSQ